MLDEYVIESEAIKKTFHEIVQHLHSPGISASFRQVFVLLAEQVSSPAQDGIPEVENQIKLEKIVEVERLHVLDIEVKTQPYEVFVLEFPIVVNEILKSLVRLVDFALKSNEAAAKVMRKCLEISRN